MRGNSYYSNLRCFCGCPFCFLLKGTAHLTGVTRLNGDECGFKLTGQALNCGVEDLVQDSTCCPCSREGYRHQKCGGRAEAAGASHCSSECYKGLWISPKQTVGVLLWSMISDPKSCIWMKPPRYMSALTFLLSFP